MINRLTRRVLLFVAVSFIGSSVAHPNAIEDRFVKAGLVDVSSVDPTIAVDLVNADAEKNFFKKNFYGGLTKAYIRGAVAHKLSRAQKNLKKKQPGYSLQILDGARPQSVSRAMYEKMKGTGFEKYVAHPDKGSMHNYGIAVDITIIDATGKKLDMGPTPFYKSTWQIYWQYALMKFGKKITDKQKCNRKLLTDVMVEAGFYTLSHEWWHFNGEQKEQVRQRYEIVE